MCVYIYIYIYIYIKKKTSIKRNILTIKQNTTGVGRAKDLPSLLYIGWVFSEVPTLQRMHVC